MPLGIRQPPELAAFVEAEGAAEPATAAAALLRASGAKVVQTVVHGIDVKAGRATGVMTAEGSLAADWVAVAAGALTPALLNTAGVRLELDQPAGLLVHTRVLPRLLRRLVIAPQIHMRQTINGEIVAGSDFGGSLPNPNAVAATEELMGLIRNEILGAEAAQLTRYSVGYRPTPKDGRPIIGEVPGVEGLYVTVMHSGITNAPAVGAFAAEEIVHGRRHALIAPYGIGRFL